jgi:hypothetical protein
MKFLAEILLGALLSASVASNAPAATPNDVSKPVATKSSAFTGIAWVDAVLDRIAGYLVDRKKMAVEQEYADKNREREEREGREAAFMTVQQKLWDFYRHVGHDTTAAEDDYNWLVFRMPKIHLVFRDATIDRALSDATSAYQQGDRTSREGLWLIDLRIGEAHKLLMSVEGKFVGPNGARSTANL